MCPDWVSKTRAPHGHKLITGARGKRVAVVCGGARIEEVVFAVAQHSCSRILIAPLLPFSPKCEVVDWYVVVLPMVRCVATTGDRVHLLYCV